MDQLLHIYYQCIDRIDSSSPGSISCGGDVHFPLFRDYYLLLQVLSFGISPSILLARTPLRQGSEISAPTSDYQYIYQMIYIHHPALHLLEGLVHLPLSLTTVLSITTLSNIFVILFFLIFSFHTLPFYDIFFLHFLVAHFFIHFFLRLLFCFLHFFFVLHFLNYYSIFYIF